MQIGQTDNPHNDPLWKAIGSLLVVISTAVIAVWRDLRRKRKDKLEPREYRDIAWDQASQVRLEYIKLLEQSNQREHSIRAELLERERDLFMKEDEIAELRISKASRAARHNALVRRLLAEGDQGDDLQIWPETNGQDAPKE